MHDKHSFLDRTAFDFQNNYHPAKRPRLLLVDDDLDHLQLFKLYLENAGYLVQDCASPKEAVEIAGSIEVDLIITDIMMPELDGLSLIDKLRNSSPDKRRVPIIALTATKYDVEEQVLKLNGPDMLCMKGQALYNLLPQIEFLLENWTIDY